MLLAGSLESRVPVHVAQCTRPAATVRRMCEADTTIFLRCPQNTHTYTDTDQKLCARRANLYSFPSYIVASRNTHTAAATGMCLCIDSRHIKINVILRRVLAIHGCAATFYGIKAFQRLRVNESWSWTCQCASVFMHKNSNRKPFKNKKISNLLINRIECVACM